MPEPSPAASVAPDFSSYLDDREFRDELSALLIDAGVSELDSLPGALRGIDGAMQTHREMVRNRPISEAKGADEADKDDRKYLADLAALAHKMA